MRKLALTAAAAAAALVVAVVGYNLLPGLGIVGPGATQPPSPVLLARGNFRYLDWGPVKFEATREGSIVTGRMTINLEGKIPLARADAGFVIVDFHCARTTDDGLLMIGGHVTDGAGLQFRVLPVGTLAALFLKRGSPVAGTLHAGTLVNLPATQTTDCLAYLDAWLPEVRPWLGGSIPGTVEFGP